MTAAAVLTVVTSGGAEPVRLGVDGITAAIGWVVALAAALGGLWQTRIASRARVSNDAQEARTQEESRRNNTINHWQKLVAQYERDMERKDAEHAEEVAELRAEIRSRTDECSDLKRWARQQEAVLLGHVPWDYNAVHAASEAGISLPPVPPLRPPEGF